MRQLVTHRLLGFPLLAALLLGHLPFHALAAPRLVLITLDGVRWQDVVGPHAQHLPALQRHFGRGGLLLGGPGAELRVDNPSVVSLPGYRELLTGRVDPDCHANHCQPLTRDTLLDLAADETGATVVAVASWSGLRHATSGRAAPAFWRSAGRQDPLSPALATALPSLRPLLSAGDRAAARPGLEDYRPDRHTAALALAVLDGLRPDVLLIGLGDTDEWAHRGDKRRYFAALQAADRLVGAVVARVDQQDGCAARPVAEGPCDCSRTTIVVTTDHGRSRHFNHHGGAKEAARIWLGLRGPRFVAAAAPPDLRMAATDLAPSLATLLGLDGGAFDSTGDSLRFAIGEPGAHEAVDGP